MTLATDSIAVDAQIRMQLPFLTSSEKRVVESIRGRTQFDNETSLREMAEDAGVSEAMIVKTAKKLGFGGFRELRQALVSYRQSDVSSLHREIAPDDSSHDVVKKVFNTALQALQETLAIIDMSAFDRAAQWLADANQRDFYGLGGSAQIARDVSHKFLRIGLRSHVYDDAHMMLMSASLLGPNDVAVCFTHSGMTRAVIEAARLARRNGARTIALTNFAGAAIADETDVCLCSTAQGSPLLGENAAARIAQLCIMDAIFVAVAQRDLSVAEERLAKTVRSVNTQRKT